MVLRYRPTTDLVAIVGCFPYIAGNPGQIMSHKQAWHRVGVTEAMDTSTITANPL